MTIRVSAIEKVESQSRKVRKYVLAVRKRNALRVVLTQAQAEVSVAGAGLTGGQLGEARRLLGLLGELIDR